MSQAKYFLDTKSFFLLEETKFSLRENEIKQMKQSLQKDNLAKGVTKLMI